MGRLRELLDARLYPRCGDNWDDELFRAQILPHLTPQSHVLDLGAGAGIVRQMNFRHFAARMCGVDPDERVTENPFLDEGVVGRGEAIPYPDETFDVVFADNVLEHLAEPEDVFAEVARVLKPGGRFLLKTANRWHYVPIIARLTPHWFHEWTGRLRGRREADTFPTRYLANTPGRIGRLAAEAGLTVRMVETWEGRPEYLRFSALTYLCGWFYERLVNLIPGLWRFRVLLTAELQKPAAEPETKHDLVPGVRHAA
ncbi:MAG: class I SAM-dependent methyltransferase [Planctomycetes bacterium]|nr:class I SAM-dependent methyltransferase [Planctomycetota bacterium]